MENLFRPGMTFMNRLKYPYKFLLIFCLGVSLFVLLLGMLHREINRSIAFTEREVLGTTYLGPLKTVLADLQRHRGLMQGFLSGERSFEERLSRIEENIDRAIQDFESIETGAVGVELDSGAQWSQFKAQWKAINEARLATTPDTSFQAHTQAIGVVLEEILRIADRSNLILDPDLDSYYLMDTIVNRLPKLTEKLGQARGLGAGIVARGFLTAEDRFALTDLAQVIQETEKSFSRNFAIIFEVNPSLWHQFGLPLRKTQSSNVDFLTLLKSDLLTAEVITLNTQEFWERASTTIDANFHLFDLLLPSLHKVLNERISERVADKWLMDTLTLLITLLIAYLFSAFYMSTRRTVINLEMVTQQLLQDETDGSQVLLEGKDEMVQVARSFSAIVGRLKTKYVQVQAEAERASLAEEQFRASEQRVRSIMNSAADGIITINEQGVVESCNGVAAMMFGYGSKEIIGNNVSLLMPSPYCEEHDQYLENYLHTGQAAVIGNRREVEGQRKGGTRFPMDLHVSEVLIGTHRLFTGIIRDLTEQKRAEKRMRGLHAVAAVLAESPSIERARPKILQAICETLDWDIGVFWGHDPESNTLRCMEVWHKPLDRVDEFAAMKKELTYGLGEGLPGRVWEAGELIWIPNLINDALFSRQHIVKQSGVRSAVGLPITYSKTKVEGVMEFFSQMDQPSDQELIQMLTSVSNQVSQFMRRKLAEEKTIIQGWELLKTNEELSEARDQALESVRLKSEFLATMSHEIRTPLNGVIGMAELISDTELNRDQQDCVQTIKTCGENLLTLINDVLDFSKIESGHCELEEIDFVLRLVVEDVLDLLAPRASEKCLEIVSLVYAEIPDYVKGDPTRIRQILLNLVGNALKFTEQGEVAVHVTLLEESEDRELIRFDVTDTGIGMNEETQGNIFQSFTQADSSTTRKYGGTGLGLAICQQLVELMDGSIGVESEKGTGSRFWFKVPFKRSRVSQGSVATQKSLRGLRVCIVDDNKTNRMVLQHYTTNWGMKVVTVVDAEQAFNMFQVVSDWGEPFDLVVLDQDMQGTNGLELAHRIKRDPKLRLMKLILLSSVGKKGDAKKTQDAGISGYLPKPVRQAQLHQCITMVMGLEEPQDPSEAIGERPTLVTRHVLEEAISSKKTRILVAEDNVVNQKITVRMLEKCGYRTDVVSNGKEAIEALHRTAYDLILMDCMMPIMDGFEAAREIRKREALNVRREAEDGEIDEASSEQQDTLHEIPDTRPIPIIALTANAMQGDREQCLVSGMSDYLAKPLRFEDLRKMLEQWLSIKTEDIPSPVCQEV